MEPIVFYLIASFICAFALLTVSSRDIFHSALWLAMALLGVACFYFFIGAEFLGVIQILVYVGGIVTLFVFAIQLTARIGDKRVRQTNEQKGTAFFISALIFVIITYGIWKTPLPDQGSLLIVTDTASIGNVLFKDYVLAFEILSIVLLVALVGAIILARKESQQ